MLRGGVSFCKFIQIYSLHSRKMRAPSSTSVLISSVALYRSSHTVSVRTQLICTRAQEILLHTVVQRSLPAGSCASSHSRADFSGDRHGSCVAFLALCRRVDVYFVYTISVDLSVCVGRIRASAMYSISSRLYTASRSGGCGPVGQATETIMGRKKEKKNAQEEQTPR